MFGFVDAGEGLPRKEFNKHLDALLITGQLNPDILCYCDREQQHVLNEVKKALKRTSETTL